MNDNSRVRVTIVGVVCLALFGALFARLWFLQVASEATYAAAAATNSRRTVQTEAPRGRILDRNGNVLVENRRATVLTADRSLEGDELDAVLGRLAELLAVEGVQNDAGDPVDTETLRARFEDPRASTFKPAVLAVDVPESVLVTVTERADEFPGITAEELPIRSYPNGSLAAHVLGYVGEINEDELADREGQGYALGESIGRSGVERAFEQELRGRPRVDVVEVDPSNRVVGDEPLESTPAVPGDDVYLTLDLGVQKVAERALADAIDQARTYQNPDLQDRYETFAAPAGSVVVLDATDGSVVAMASYPTFPVERFVGGIPQTLWEQLNDKEGPYGVEPLVNRATSGQYAPGSTFKLVTATAALETGLRTPTEPFDDPGVITVAGNPFRNAGGRNYGVVDMRGALTSSVDTYFYEIGRRLWQAYHDPATSDYDGEAIQHVARRFGFGSPTGIDLAEADGRVPDATWKADFAGVLYPPEKDAQQPDNAELRRQNSIWLPGDNINLAVGQGDMLATPLQLADAYAAFANGGTRYRPQLAAKVVDASGRVVEQGASEANGTVDLSATDRATILDGLVGAVSDPAGTAALAFSGFPFDQVPVAGKTGTAQVNDKGDTSLFVGFAPAHAPKYVVASVIEQAGYGSRVAAPVVRRVLEQLFGLPGAPLVVPPQQGGVVD